MVVAIFMKSNDLPYFVSKFCVEVCCCILVVA